jgi:hypothetical protein
VTLALLLTGWSGTVLAPSRGWNTRGGIESEPAQHPTPEISYTLTRDGDGVRLAAAGTLDVQKKVLPDGSTDVTIACGGDVVSMAATHVAVVVTRGDRPVTVAVNGGHDAQLGRVRELLLGSAAARAARTLATVLEEAGTDAPARMGIRLTGALLAQMDGMKARCGASAASSTPARVPHQFADRDVSRIMNRESRIDDEEACSAGGGRSRHPIPALAGSG